MSDRLTTVPWQIQPVREVQSYYLHQPEPVHVGPDTSPYCQARARLDLDNLSAIRTRATKEDCQAACSMVPPQCGGKLIEPILTRVDIKPKGLV